MTTTRSLHRQWTIRALITFCVAFAACAAPQAPKPKPLTAVDYWPLAVGYSWTYQISIGQGAPQQDQVRIVKQNADGFFVDSRGATIQHHPAGVYDGQRFLIRDPLEPGAKWVAVPSANSLERYEIVAVGFTATVPAGVFQNCVKVRSTNRMDEHKTLIGEWTYTPGVGMILFTSALQIDDRPPLPQAEMQLVQYALAASR